MIKIFSDNFWKLIDLVNKKKYGREILEDSIDYQAMYEQQKQRADELEKQNDILKHNIRVELDSSRNMYIGMCEQKQHADRAEKRWSELREYLEERMETSKTDCEDNKYIYSRYKTCKNTLFKMHDLEEDGE